MPTRLALLYDRLGMALFLHPASVKALLAYWDYVFQMEPGHEAIGEHAARMLELLTLELNRCDLGVWAYPTPDPLRYDFKLRLFKDHSGFVCSRQLLLAAKRGVVLRLLQHLLQPATRLTGSSSSVGFANSAAATTRHERFYECYRGNTQLYDYFQPEYFALLFCDYTLGQWAKARLPELLPQLVPELCARLTAAWHGIAKQRPSVPLYARLLELFVRHGDHFASLHAEVSALAGAACREALARLSELWPAREPSTVKKEDDMELV